MATLKVSRFGWVGLFRSQKVLVDGQVAALLDHGGTAFIDVAPGRHTITTKMDWIESDPLQVIVGDGETVVIEVGGPIALMGMHLQVRLKRD
jgi:hypothetical protein